MLPFIQCELLIKLPHTTPLQQNGIIAPSDFLVAQKMLDAVPIKVKIPLDLLSLVDIIEFISEKEMQNILKEVISKVLETNKVNIIYVFAQGIRIGKKFIENTQVPPFILPGVLRVITEDRCVFLFEYVREKTGKNFDISHDKDYMNITVTPKSKQV